MPYGLQSQFISVTNNNKPSLADIQQHIFPAIERYNAVNKRFEGKPDRDSVSKSRVVTGFAASLSYDGNKDLIAKFKPCILCSGGDRSADHPIHKCVKFSSPLAKVNKLKYLGACIKCTYTNHAADKCVFKFRNQCCYCSGSHFSFLCTSAGQEKAIVKNVKRKNGNISSGAVGIECRTLNSRSDCATILPTFSAYFSNGNSIHCMKDTGAQCSFIVESVARRENLKVLDDNLELTINGFNCSKPYTSKLVEVNLKFGNIIRTIPAVCIPQINTSLKLKGINNIIR